MSVCVHVCEHMCVYTVDVFKSEDNFWSWSSFPTVGAGHSAQVIRGVLKVPLLTKLP